MQVRRIEDDARGNVHRAGRGDADGGDAVHANRGVAHGGANRFAHPFEAELLAALCLGRQADVAQRPPGVIDDAGFHRRAANIQTDIVWGIRHGDDVRRESGCRQG